MKPWLEASGAVGLNALELADFPSTGRGVKTRRRIKSGERILTIPRDTLWTVEAAHSDPLLGPALLSAQPPLSVEDTLALYLLFVRSRDESESRYAGLGSHVAALPTRYGSSIFFTEEELQVCVGSSLHAVTQQLKVRIEEDYRSLVVRVLGPYPQLFPLDKFTIEDYKWALCTVWSRAMDFSLPEGKSVRLIAPFADMLNHSSQVKQCHAYDPVSGSASVFAGKDYEVGDQVFISYGSVPNNRLLRLYGFVMPDNPHDSYDLVLSTHPEAPFFQQKQRLWALAGFEETTTISLTLADPLPSKVIQYLRIQRLGVSELADLMSGQINAAEKVNDENEEEVLRFLVESLSGLLDGFGTPLKKLEAQLADSVFAAGGNAWAAAHVSLGEQRVLRSARKRAQQLLAGLASADGKEGVSSVLEHCAKCGVGSASLMLCGRCKSVKYCGRACQVSHFKDHKATCRASQPKNG